MSRPQGWEVAAFAVTLAVSGLVALTVLFAGTGTYHDIAVREAIERSGFRVPGWADPAFGGGIEIVRYPLGTLVELHARTVDYLLRLAPELPVSPTRGDFYSPQERAHLADVRAVFLFTRIAMVAAFAVCAGLALLAQARGHLSRLLRAGGLAAAAGVAVVGLVAGLAFDAAFLWFHQVFFPQGNFLFDPSASNMLTLYPEAYFYSVTLRIGGVFVAGSLALAAIGHASLRRRAPSA